ncbi:MAG: hypothetical protein AAF717_02075 [Bacteroidota bacterium]
MKKMMFLLSVVILGLMSFTLLESTKTDYPDEISEEIAEFLDSEYLTTIENEALKSDLEKKFFFLFDKVYEIRAQHSDANGYYYLLLVDTEGKQKIELLKIEESDYLNETYNYINFSNITVNQGSVVCKEGIVSTKPGICPLLCLPYTDTTECLGISCGVFVNGECVLQ